MFQQLGMVLLGLADESLSTMAADSTEIEHGSNLGLNPRNKVSERFSFPNLELKRLSTIIRR